jgi:glutamine synthetase
VDAAKALISQKNIDLFQRHGVFSRKELESRYEIQLESYAKTVNIEANTMIEMTRRQIIPAVVKYAKFLSETLVSLKETGLAVDVSLEAGMLKDVSAASAALRTALAKLEKAQEKAATLENGWEKAAYYRDKILPAMEALRAPADTLEVLLGKEFWPMPTYTDLMFGIL